MPSDSSLFLHPAQIPDGGDPHWIRKTLFSLPQWSIPATIGTVVSFICTASIPLLLGKVIDKGVTPHDKDSLIRWLVALTVVATSGALIGIFGRYASMRTVMNIRHGLRIKLSARALDPRGMGGPARTPGELLSITTSDAHKVGESVMLTIFPAAEIAGILYAGIIITTISPWLGAVIFLGAPVIVVLASRIALPLRDKAIVRQMRVAAAASSATDTLQGLRILKGLGSVDIMRRRYKALSEEAYKATINVEKTQSVLNGVTEAIGSLYVIGIALGAGVMALNGHMTVGQLLTVVGMTQFIIMPMTMMGKFLLAGWATLSSSSRRILEVLDAPWGDYAPLSAEQHAMLRDQIVPGLTVITERPDEALTVLRRLPRDKVLVAPHKADLFQGTIQENVSLDPKRAQEALEVAHGMDIPGGSQRMVGEAGGQLSGGQKQRVALARALATDVEVVVLVDPTTAVDSVTEQNIAHNVAQFRAGQPTLIFTDAPAWIAVADVVKESMELPGEFEDKAQKEVGAHE